MLEMDSSFNNVTNQWRKSAVMFNIAPLIVDFFLSQKISQIVLLVCWSEGMHDTIKELAQHGLSTSVLQWMNNNGVLDRDNNSARIGVVIDSTCSSLNAVLHWIDMMNGNVSDMHHVHWLVLSNQDYNPAIVSKNHNSAAVIIASQQCYPSQSLVLLYHLNQIKSLEFLAGYWSDENGLELYNNFQWSSDQKLQNVTVTTTSLSYADNQQRRHIYDHNILHLLAEVLNFRLKETNTRGLYSKSSELQLLQQLADDCADITSSSILVTEDKIGLADFTFAIGHFRPYLYYKVQSVRSARNIYILPFSVGVWATLGALLLAITASLTFILRRESHLTFSLEELQPKWEFGEVLLVTVGAICQQGSARNPTASAARTLFITLFVLAVLMYTAYSASVISLLSSPSSVISTLQGILHHSSSMDLVLLDSHYYHEDFKKEKNLVSSKLHDLEETAAYMDLSAGMESTLKGEVAFCADREEAYTYLHQSGQTEEILCNVGKISLLQGSAFQRCFALRSDSPYTKIFNFGIIKLKEFGLLQREQQYWFNVEPFCDTPEPPPGSRFVSIMLSNIYPLLQLLTLGILCAIILLPVEILIHYSKKWYQFKYGSWISQPGFQSVSVRKKMSPQLPLPFVQ